MKWLCFSSGRNEASSTQQTIDEVVSGASGVKFYSYKELRIATQSFCSSMKIGEGGFGSVYKGRLSNGTEVAVKVLSAESTQGLREFLTELKLIANLDHNNLVKLHGCCVEESNRIIVYGYLENNSLAQTLLGQNCNAIKFSWEVRKRIAIGVAEGLAYLHEGIQPHIIHRDIKASNVLLDKNLTAKISDFGLAKLMAPSMTHVSTRVAGTFGYLAPEYAMQGRLNKKADIYSFGVLLLEIVSGSRSRDRSQPPGEQYLLERAWKAYGVGSEVVPKVASLVKDQLREDLDAEQVCTFFKVALLCTQEKSMLRPSMSTVVKMLEGEVDVSQMEMSRPGIFSEFGGLIATKDPTPKDEAADPSLSSGTRTTDDDDAPFISGESFFTYPSLTISRISERSDH